MSIYYSSLSHHVMIMIIMRNRDNSFALTEMFQQYECVQNFDPGSLAHRILHCPANG